MTWCIEVPYRYLFLNTVSLNIAFWTPDISFGEITVLLSGNISLAAEATVLTRQACRCRGKEASRTQTTNSIRNDLFTLHCGRDAHAMVREKNHTKNMATKYRNFQDQPSHNEYCYDAKPCCYLDMCIENCRPSTGPRNWFYYEVAFSRTTFLMFHSCNNFSFANATVYTYT
jgi:hypothetical protein